MSKYIPSPRDWVADQVELYESSGGTKGLTLRNTDYPVVIVTNRGWRTSAVRKTPLMRVADGDNYILMGSNGGASDDPLWVNNLRSNPNVTIQDETEVYPMRVRELEDGTERDRLWKIAVETFPRYQQYQDNADKADRIIPVFLAEPIESE